MAERHGRNRRRMNVFPINPLAASSVSPDVRSIKENAPRISIITPVLNRREFVLDAIQSVRSQDYPAYEHLVVDGGSVDGTQELLARESSIRLIEGPDRNSHDGMNRGLKAATGDVIGFLNSDDRYGPRSLAAVAAYFSDNPDAEVVVVRAHICRIGGDGIAHAVAEIRHSIEEGFAWDELLYGTPAFNSWFFKRAVFDNLGRFDPDLEIAADRHFLLRLAMAGIRPRQILPTVYSYLDHQGSATLATNFDRDRRLLAEHLEIAERLLARPMSKVMRNRLADWRAFEMLREIYAGRLSKGSGQTFGDLLRWSAREPMWPLRFVRGALSRRAYRRHLANGAASANRSGCL